MAKTTGPLASFDASGKFADTIVFAKWRGVRYARLLVTPSNPQTTTQMGNRAGLAAVGKITKIANKSGVAVTAIKAITPGGQSWNSFFGREMLGSNNSNFTAEKGFYENVANETIVGYYDTAAQAKNIEAVDLDGTSNTQIPAGLSLLMAYAAANRLGLASAQVAPHSVTQQDVTNFATALI